MDSMEGRLVSLGFAATRPEPVCWHACRVGAAPEAPRAGSGPEPAASPALLGWRRRLAATGRPAPYRITRLGDWR